MLDPQVIPEEIMSREVGLGCESLTSFASVVSQQQCYGHCPCDCSTQQLKEQLRSTLVATQCRGDTALTFWLFWRRSTASSVFQVGAHGGAQTPSTGLRHPSLEEGTGKRCSECGSSLHSFVPFPPCPRPE